MDKWNANEAALDEFTAGQRDNVNSAAGGAVDALKTDADASIEAVSGAGSRGAGRMARLVSTYTHALHQTENIKATQLKDTEQHIQMRLRNTIEKLLNVRDDGIVRLWLSNLNSDLRLR
jgi:molecular chaperone GrpE (heat shock protein)